MTNNNIIPIILCGGSGSRLWPLSRKSFPKQFLQIKLGEESSLLQSTQKRLLGLRNLSNPIIICNEEHRFIAAEQFREINVKPEAIILETCGRNTAPAIAVGALKAIEKGDDPFLLVLSSDHSIKDNNEFQATIEQGIEYANNGLLVTFGIVPKSPETGYGYIECIRKFSLDNKKGIPIKKFIEKPNKEKAKKLIRDNHYLWNSGMFLFRASTILEELEKFQPDIVSICNDSLKKSKIDLDFIRLENVSFEKCQNISIDVGVMEKTKRGIVLPLDAGWSDIGSWKSLWEHEEKDAENNFVMGNVITRDTTNSYIRSNERLVVGIGIKNLIIIETSDAILVCDNKYDQHLKEIVNHLQKEGYEEGITHKKVYRPWGNFFSLVEDVDWKVKRIEIKQGASLSLQLHKKRSEHWVVVKGTALAQLENKEIILEENQSIYIPFGTKHRLSNPTSNPLVIIEVQCGKYLGEDDIVRFNDVYGRV